ncbi:hypothetical protein [Flavilitoribacter nigricans]|uniref:Uncharacterized protein n=1 Tax=Flavilitoribacter nigricans (strain ATCC 23147 / DSM 23189 / NBRC 102662 / NCIMB 1420 / SS-2) TaxID=1122177 RepID=A0A2D0NHC4_FLAN2|nr:hypothetical protein [Flavilitoribacter nigricans]PHN07877.1 hypothetical protein CRP01_03755 [Flavilitoribacter nigricans DSM 23189 = NBRC 102662]
MEIARLTRKNSLLHYYLLIGITLLLTAPVSAQSVLREGFSSEQLTASAAWTVDSFLFNVQGYTHEINTSERLREVIRLLGDDHSLLAEIIVLMNANYDTITSHFLRLRADAIYRDLVYFNVPPSQFQVKDSLVSRFDAVFTPDEAYRKIIVRFSRSAAYLNEMQLLEEAREMPANYLAYFRTLESRQLGAKDPQEVTELKESYQLPELIDQFYREYYRPPSGQQFEVLPLTYPIEIGNIHYDTIPGWSCGIMDRQPDEQISYSTVEVSNYVYQYRAAIETAKRPLFADQHQLRALADYLAYDFSYQISSEINIPFNIRPVSETRSRLEAISKVISPRYDYLIRGNCNSHYFWNFHWNISAPYTIRKIGIDEASRSAYLNYEDSQGETQYAVYDLGEAGWTNRHAPSASLPGHYLYLVVILSIILLIGGQFVRN